MTFEDTDFRQETLDLDNPFDLKLVKDFLFKLGFEFDPTEVECTMIVYNLKGELVGTRFTSWADFKICVCCTQIP